MAVGHLPPRSDDLETAISSTQHHASVPNSVDIGNAPVNGHVSKPSSGSFANGVESTYEPIAIIGCGMRLPGNVNSDQALWELIDGRQEGRCKVPYSRYNVDSFYGPGKAGHVCTDHGHFLQEVNLAESDTSFWSMTRKDIEETDPQQRLALEVVYECLQSSGTTKWRGKNIGTYFGIFGEDWADMGAKETQQTSMYRIMARGDFVVANRVSYEFGLQGPSMVVRTACSSSLTGLHEACMAIHHGDCESAIVGGTNLILNPNMTIAMTEQGVLSPDGRCKTFDRQANGYVRGEGVVAIHIKKLADAVRDGDPIRAVIRSSCLNSDGRTAGLSQPSSGSHEALMRRSHALAGIDDLSKTAMIECHGTGTQIGDPIEAMAVARAFSGHGIYIGSVKPNLGHSEGASGVTSIIKSMLALERSLIPPNINFQDPNPKIPFDKCKLHVATQTTHWPVGKAERIGVNRRVVARSVFDLSPALTTFSFGIGGANAHVLLESAREVGHPQSRSPTPATRLRYLLPFSAANADALRTTIQRHEAYLKKHPEYLADLSYTLAVRREPLGHRAFSVVTADTADQQLQISPFERSSEARQTAFVFTGQGAQWAQMGAELMSETVFSSSIDSMEAVLAECQHAPKWSLRDELSKSVGRSRLSEAEFSQPCCTAIQIALVDVFRHWGVFPTAVVGHSSGEIAAAYASQALSAKDAILAAYYRGLVTKNIKTKGGMAAIGLGRSQVKPYLRPGVLIACENSPASVTLSGDLDILDEVSEALKADFPDALVRPLKVDQAYHSQHMRAVELEYLDAIKAIPSANPETLFFSSVTGTKLDGIRLDASYWAQNLVSPVLFSQAASELLKEVPSAVLVEIGPHSALAGPLRQIIKANNITGTDYVSTLIRKQDALYALLQCSGRLFQCGVDLDFAAVVPRAQVLVDLPTYPWQREGNYWAESRLSRGWRQRAHPKHDPLGTRIVEASEYDPTWRNLLRLDDVPWIRDHNVSGDVIFPGAGYIAMVGEAARQLTGKLDFSLREVNILSALVMHEGDITEIITHLKPVRLTTTLESVWYDFEISSLSGERWIKHAVGQVRGGCNYDPAVPYFHPGKRRVPSERWYSVMKRFGLNYGPRFQGLRSIAAEVSERVATALIDNSVHASESPYAIHPCTVDLVFQLFSVAAYKGLSRLFDQLSVPTYVEELYIRPTSEEIIVRATTDISPRGSLAGDAVGITAGGGAVFHMKNLKLSPLADAEDVRGNDPHAAIELVWKPDINLVDNAELMHVSKDMSHLTCIAERMTLACMVECRARFAGKAPQQAFLSKFSAWLDHICDLALRGAYPLVDDDEAISQMPCSQRQDLIEELYQELVPTEGRPVATAIYRIYHAAEAIFSDHTNALQILLEDDILSQIYDFGRVISTNSDFFVLAAHSKPNLKILEIGAGTGGTTDTILPLLASLPPYNDRNYSSYTFTDVSPGFFGPAKERFRGFTAVEYKVLDISKDPIEQGFESEGFDLIVASNVIHATADLTQTLKHCRKLLSPTGRFFLQELSPPTKWVNFVMGMLPGWWLGEQDGRVEEPYISPAQWEKHLRSAGFDIDSVHHDGQFNATMVVLPAKAPPPSKITLLVGNPDDRHAQDMSLLLTAKGYGVDIRNWGQPFPPGQDIVSFLDVGAPFFHNMQHCVYSQFKDFVQACKDSRILWVTGAAQVECADPRYAMVLGMARTLRTELDIKIGTLELDRFDHAAWDAVAWVLEAFQRRSHTGLMEPDTEWAFAGGFLNVPRFHWTSVNKQLCLPEPGASAKKLDIEKRGFLQTLHWKSYSPPAPQGDHLIVRNRAVGLNFKDVLISMGIVEGDVNEGSGLGCESAGFVETVGPEVKHLVPGDRCMVFASGAFSTRLMTNESVCVRIPESLSFEEAAGMATVYCTVLYSLFDKANLQKGQSVLIHSACGGVGIAAIQVCQSLGADIYCTVGSEVKVQYLMKTYNIPREKISNSRDLTFQRDVLHATQGRGVDVVLNSLSGELLHGSWECVAEFGFMVEIGKRDLIGKGKLALDLFERNRSYCGVDFAQICGERPWITARLMKQMMEMYDRGEIKAIQPMTIFESARIEDAMRFMQKGSHLGKVIVTLPESEENLTTLNAKQKFRLRSDASYFLVGGLGGLGQAIAIWMAEAGATEIIFLSRSAEDPKYAGFAEELRALGCTAMMVAGSVTDEASVELAIKRTTKPLRGVMQASMVLLDKAFPEMDFDDWQTVVQPKVQGTWNLHNVCSRYAIDLDFFLLFSSFSGIVGQWGQANYSSANTFLDAFVQYRRGQGLPAAAVDIGVMHDIGYVSRNAHVMEHFRTTSTHVLYEQDLLDTLHLVINGSHAADSHEQHPKTQNIADWQYVNKGQVAIGLRSTQPLSVPSNRTLWKNDPRTALYRNTENQDSSDAVSDNEKLKRFLSEASADPSTLDGDESARFLAVEIGQTLFAFLMRDAELLDLTSSFDRLGVDSLVSIELRNWFKHKLGFEITVLEILGSPCLLALGKFSAVQLKKKFTGGEKVQRDDLDAGRKYQDTYLETVMP